MRQTHIDSCGVSWSLGAANATLKIRRPPPESCVTTPPVTRRRAGVYNLLLKQLGDGPISGGGLPLQDIDQASDESRRHP